MINNKTLFEIYLIMRFIVSLIPIFLIGLTIVARAEGIDIFQLGYYDYRFFGIYPLVGFTLIFSIISERIKPAFIEFGFANNEIIIKTYNPHLNKKSTPFVLFGYKKRIHEFKISKEEYNDYKLTIKKFGIHKELKLQKTNISGVYESPNINISLLGQEKYTNLILAVDRLRTRICLN